MNFFKRKPSVSVTSEQLDNALSLQTDKIMAAIDQATTDVEAAAADLKQAIADKGKEISAKLDNLQTQITTGQPVSVLTGLVNELKADAAAVRSIGEAPAAPAATDAQLPSA